jgi:putative DNA primase/helicase
VDLDAAAMPSAPAQTEESAAVAEAMAFLKENLRHGAKAAIYLIRDAKTAGISERTLRRAKFKLGIISKVWPYGLHGGDRWGWELPGGEKPEGELPEGELPEGELPEDE